MNRKFYTDDVKLEPYWWEAAPRRRFPPVELPPKVDVAIVGSGYTGLSAALTLARAGRSVVVLEAGDPGEGASSRNGGGFGTLVKPSLSTLSKQMGLERAVVMLKGAMEAQDFLARLVDTEKIECHYTRTGRITGAHAPKYYDSMSRDLDLQRKHLGIEGEMVPRAEQHRVIGTDHYQGVRITNQSGTIHPALYHQGLLDRTLQAGAIVAGQRRVTGIRREANGFHLLAESTSLIAREVILATNGYTEKVTPWLRRRIIPIQSQIIVTEPVGRETMERLIPASRMVGDTCRLNHYYRATPDGTRMLFGGRAGAWQADPRNSGAHLYAHMTMFYPELAKVRVTHSWTGMTGYTFDMLPHMGVRDGIHYAAGFCGSGTAMAAYLGHKIALRVMGDPAAANVFEDRSFPTRPFYSGKPWFLPPLLVYYGWLDGMRR